MQEDIYPVRVIGWLTLILIVAYCHVMCALAVGRWMAWAAVDRGEESRGFLRFLGLFWPITLPIFCVVFWTCRLCEKKSNWHPIRTFEDRFDYVLDFLWSKKDKHGDHPN